MNTTTTTGELTTGEPTVELAPDRAMLRDWYRPADFQLMNAQYFPSEGSVDWFVRMHRQELEREGAIAMIGGRVHLHGPTLVRLIVEVGRRLATERSYTSQ